MAVKKKVVKNKPKKISPYKIFQDWLFNPRPQAEFPMECIKGINKRAVLGSLGQLDGITIFLNKYFNNFGTMSMNDVEFYNFIRTDIIKKYRIKKNDLSFFKSEKRDKSIKELKQTFPHLKDIEISKFMELVKDDPEYDQLCENLGLKKTKKKKMTKKDKKESDKFKMESKNIDVEKDTVDVIDVKTWFENFDKKIKCENGVYFQVT